MSQQIICKVESKYKKESLTPFRIGDTVKVHVKIKEGDKERIQPFIGVVIAKKGRGLTRTFKVRRIVSNQGVERTFMLHSPHIDKIEVLRSGKVRRAKLYFLRDRVGKARRLREKRVKRAIAPEVSDDSTQGQPSSEQSQSEEALVQV